MGAFDWTQKHVKASGPGSTGKVKKDGYAAGPVPTGQVGTKTGKTPHAGYSGPSVAQAK